MEDVLDVYTRPYDPKRPQVCLDEASKQLLADVQPPLPARPGATATVDHEYARHGTAALFMVCEPLAGRRHVRVRDRRTAVDWAHVIKELVDERYPTAEKIVLVMDQLNTHSVASLYEAFPPTEARRLAKKLELHYTPKHGSWLNMAELGRARAQRPGAPVPRRPHARPAHPRQGHRRVGTQAQCPPLRRQLALHHQRRTHQAHAPLSFTSRLTDH